MNLTAACGQMWCGWLALCGCLQFRDKYFYKALLVCFTSTDCIKDEDISGILTPSLSASVSKGINTKMPS